MWRAVASGSVLLGMVACSASIRPVESVLADVQRDEVAAAAAMRGHGVGLEGRVKDKGLKTERELAVKFNWNTGHANEVQKNLGYIDLEGPSGAGTGHAVCLFEPEAFDWLATVREGQSVRLTCQFSHVEGERPGRYPVFRDCWVQY